jgi:hypothetical protein
MEVVAMASIDAPARHWSAFVLSVVVFTLALVLAITPARSASLTPGEIANEGPVATTAAPNAVINAPSRTSGGDYATTVLNDSWDMCNPNDIVRTQEIVSLTFANCIATFTDDASTHPGPPPTGDPALWLRTGAYFDDPRSPVDPQRYRYITYRFREDRPGGPDPFRGSLSRFIFWRNQPPVETTTYPDNVTLPGWNIYQYDLVNSPLEPGSRPWLSWDELRIVRFDPNELPDEMVTSQLDYVLLTGRPWADQSYLIRWSRTEGNANAVARLYYDTDQNPASGRILIGQTTLGSGSFMWNTSTVPEGAYFIYLEMEEAGQPARGVYSEVPVVVRRQAGITWGGFNRNLTPANDFASQRGNPWDFDSAGDLDRRLLPAGHSGLGNVSIQNGVLSATTTDGDPQLFLNMPGGAQINTGQYNKLSFRMYSGRTDGAIEAMFHWFRTDGSIAASAFIPVYPGWNTYTLDLGTVPQWAGTVQYLRFDPATGPGVNFSLDWIRLTQPATVNLAWTNRNFAADTRLSLHAVPLRDPSQVIPVARNISSASVAWDYGALAPGTYRLVARVDDRVSDINEITTCLVVGQALQAAGEAMETQGVLGPLNIRTYLPAVFDSHC